MSADVRFPEGFLWGAATSAYQIEGSPLADGAGPSIWHRFAHTPGAIANGDTGDVACDHYRRWAEDVALLRELEIPAYRFSLSWSRLFPAGRGARNRHGFDFYARLIDGLLDAGIRPVPTLFHWDLPAALEDRGGWTNRDVARWFADYAGAAFQAYADRVGMWCTINEPFMISDAGHRKGVHAPGRRSLADAAQAALHLLLAHGGAVRAYREAARGAIGLVVNLEPQHPFSDSPDDRAAAARADAYMNRQYLDPVLSGEDPVELRELFGERWPERSAEDVAAIRETIDFLGVNYYSRSRVRHDPSAPPLFTRAEPPPAAESTDMGWEIHPDGLREILAWVTRRYGRMPVYVTENGSAFADPEPRNGVVEDPRRAAYLREHLRAASRAIHEGVDLRGYFAWSLLDNFEWQYGYAKRFGLVHVDFATQRRTPKRSALEYREIIRANGASLGVS